MGLVTFGRWIYPFVLAIGREWGGMRLRVGLSETDMGGGETERGVNETERWVE